MEAARGRLAGLCHCIVVMEASALRATVSRTSASPEAELSMRGVTTATIPSKGLQRQLKLLTLADCSAATPRGSLVKGLFAPGDLIVLFGQPGSGKRALAPYMAHAIAAGRIVFGRKVRTGPVLYIASEDPEGMKMRATALRAVYGDTENFFMTPDAIDLEGNGNATPPDLEAIIEAANRIGAVLIIIDTMARAFPGLDENDGQAMGCASRPHGCD
jgi:hypothetical protein